MKEFSKKIDIELEHKDDDNNITNNYIEKIENKYEISGNNKIIEEEDNDLREGKYEKFNIPSELKKTFIITSILFIVGSILIGIGFIEQIRQDVPGVSISMWTLGGICFIPGGYYSYQFYKAYKAQGDDRQDILDNIPQL